MKKNLEKAEMLPSDRNSPNSRYTAHDSPTPNQSTPQDLHKDDAPNVSPEPTDSAVAFAEEGVSPSGFYDDKDEDAFDKKTLSHDTFSFIIYSKVKSLPFFCAMLVFSMQIIIYVIIAVNIIDLTNEKNPVSFPPDVDLPVRISEALAILIAIMTQDDVRKALILSREQFHQGGLPEGKNDLPHAFEGATKAKWGVSIFLRATEGLLGLSITFLMIMQSSTVTDLLLNFLAIEFVSKLDDVVFALAREALLGSTLKEEAKNLCDKVYYVNHQFSKAAPYYTFAYFVVLPLIMLVGWGFIWFYQKSGKYLCQQILIQLGDEQLPMLGTFSGLFISQRKSFVGNFDRLMYAPIDNRDGGPLLGYCEEEKRWTLSLSQGGAPNPCDWYAASEESEDFDVLATANSPWFVKTAQNRAIPLGQNLVACHDCTDNLCGPYGKCSNKGTCECDPGYYGLRCEYPEPCQRLEIDPRDEGFLKEGGDYFASKYYRLEGAEAYNHPVYTSLGENQTLSDETDIILFTGVRWILSSKYLFPGLKDLNDVSGLATYFSQFHGHFTNYTASYVSEPIHIDSPLDSTASPLSVRWQYSSQTSESRDQRLQPDLQKDFIGSSFFCAVCNNNTNLCSYGSVCQLDGTCGDCPNDSSGTMCQIPPTSNGHCDPYFNNINFGFDGGDCCESTCRSTPENTCGKAGQGYIDTGYPSCVRASNQWELSGDPIYGVSSVSRSGLAIALSGKGTILAVADPGKSIVRLFYKAGAEWIEIGQVQGPPGSNFGAAIALSDSDTITNNPRSSTTVTLAVGAPNFVRVFACSTIGCMQRGEDIVGRGRYGTSLSISSDGNTIAIGGGDGVKVFTWKVDFFYSKWQQKGNVTVWSPWYWSRKLAVSQFLMQGYYVSLSGDYLAVGSLYGSQFSCDPLPIASLIPEAYKWDGDGWAQLGETTSENFGLGDEDRGDKFYGSGSPNLLDSDVGASYSASWPFKSVVIKGSVLAIGYKSSVAVYEWNETSWEWIPREIELQSADDIDFVGWSVDLSEDANILAVGTSTSVENPQPTDESVRMYQWNGKRYNALFNGVLGGSANSVSLSSDGKAVAVGLPYDAWKGGSTRVYNFHPSSPCDDLSNTILRISFTTDSYPEETSWELRVDSQVKMSSGSLEGYMYTTFVEEICVPVTSCITFIVYDRNGLNHPGVFALMLNGTEVARGDGDFELYDMKSIGDCSCSEDEAPFTLFFSSTYTAEWNILEQNTLSRYTGGAGDLLWISECIPKSCYYLSLRPNPGSESCELGLVSGERGIEYDATYDGGSISSTIIHDQLCSHSQNYQACVNCRFGECPSPTTSGPLKCGEGSNLIKIEIHLGDPRPWPWVWDTYWSLVDKGAGNAIILEGGQYFVKGATIFEEVCKPANACYHFEMKGVDAVHVIYIDGKLTNLDEIGDSCPLESV